MPWEVERSPPTPGGTSRRWCVSKRGGRWPEGRSESTRHRASGCREWRADRTRVWPAARSGRRTLAISASARSGSATFLIPKAIVAASHVAVPTGMQVASPRTSRIERTRSSEAIFGLAQAKHRAGEVDADDRCTGNSTNCRDREIGGPVHRSRTRALGREAQGVHGLVAPSAIEPGAEDAVQQVVPRRDGIEHPGNAGRGLVGAGHPFHAGYSSCLKPSAPRIFPAMKSARSSSVFGIW